MPRFSVLIPCYNCSKTLSNTLFSCLQQKYTDFEVVLIDDCSKESVENIYNQFLPHFADKNISLTYYKNSVNSGVSFSRNLAWDIAIGEYICFLDSDDIWHESKLLIMDHFLNANGCECLCHYHTDNNDKFNTERVSTKYKIAKLSLFDLLLKNPAQTSCFVLKRSVSDRFDITMSYCEDYDLWLRISRAHSIYRLSGLPLTLLSRPQKTPGGLSANRTKMRLGLLTAYSKFARLNNIIRLILPVLFLYAFLKHLRSEILYFIYLLKNKNVP